MKKPIKKNDKELFSLIELKIKNSQYLFVDHAKLRLKQRFISPLDVLNILKGMDGYRRRRNKVKDIFEPVSIVDDAQDWKYCIEGKDPDDNKIRIIVTFNNDLMPIITVIRI